MDPIGISGLVASILPIAYQVAAGIFGFALEAHDNSETLNAFASEIQGLTRILEAAISTIDDANFPARLDRGPSVEVCRALHGAVDDIRLYLERLRLRVQRIQGDSANRNLYRNTIRTFAARINSTGVNDLRSLLQTHQLSLNTALVMVHLHHTTHTAGHQQADLRPEIYRLTRIVQRLATAADLERLRDDLTNHHIRDLQGVALQVVENASQTAASTAGSEMSEPLKSRARRRIDEWLNQNVSEDSRTTNLGSWVSHEASTDHAQISSIHIQGSSLQGSPLDLGGHQTQPTSSNGEEATTITGTTRHSQISKIILATLCSHPIKRRIKYVLLIYFIILLCLAIFCLAFSCAVDPKINSNLRCSAVPTLFIGIMTTVWCILRLLHINGRIRWTTVFGHFGFKVDGALG